MKVDSDNLCEIVYAMMTNIIIEIVGARIGLLEFRFNSIADSIPDVIRQQLIPFLNLICSLLCMVSIDCHFWDDAAMIIKLNSSNIRVIDERIVRTCIMIK